MASVVAGEHVGVGVAPGAGRAGRVQNNQVLDVRRKDVAVEVRVRVKHAHHVDRVRSLARFFHHPVEPVVDRIGIVAGAADERILAGAAVEHIVAGVAEDHVVALAARDVLDIHQRIDADLAPDGPAGRQVHHHRRRGAGEGNGVAPVAAIEGVVTSGTLQRVVAQSAAQHIGAGVSDQGVVVVVAGSVDGIAPGQDKSLDVLAQGITDGRLDRVGPRVGVFDDRIADIVDHVAVVADTARHDVGPGAAVKHVVPGETASPEFAVNHISRAGILSALVISRSAHQQITDTVAIDVAGGRHG